MKRIRTDKQIHIRLKPDEYAKLKKIADAAQFQTTVTDVARRLLMESVDARLLVKWTMADVR
jgi:hypothetical protein